MRVGIGYDIHRIVVAIHPSSLIIGGVPIPSIYKTLAHSDGDVLLHALTDAMLGAFALGDIGQWFPDNKKENKGRSSSEFVVEVKRKLLELGWRVQQVDSVIFLEEPKLSPHSDKVRQSLARLLDCELSDISLKAKTMEGMGEIGRGEAIAAQVVLTLKPA